MSIFPQQYRRQSYKRYFLLKKTSLVLKDLFSLKEDLYSLEKDLFSLKKDCNSLKTKNGIYINGEPMLSQHCLDWMWHIITKGPQALLNLPPIV